MSLLGKQNVLPEVALCMGKELGPWPGQQSAGRKEPGESGESQPEKCVQGPGLGWLQPEPHERTPCADLSAAGRLCEAFQSSDQVDMLGIRIKSCEVFLSDWKALYRSSGSRKMGKGESNLKETLRGHPLLPDSYHDWVIYAFWHRWRCTHEGEGGMEE